MGGSHAEETSNGCHSAPLLPSLSKHIHRSPVLLVCGNTSRNALRNINHNTIRIVLCKSEFWNAHAMADLELGRDRNVRHVRVSHWNYLD